MLRLLPKPTITQSNVTPIASPTTGTRPSALVYTILRHGRGMTSQEVELRLLRSLAAQPEGQDWTGGPLPAA